MKANGFRKKADVYRILIGLVAVFFTVLLFSVRTKAAGSNAYAYGEDNGCKWSIDQNGKLTVRSTSKESDLRNNAWRKYKAHIKSVDIDVPYSSNLAGMFDGFDKLETAKVKIDKTTGDAYRMFACYQWRDSTPYSKLKSVDLTEVNFSGVTGTKCMFYFCVALKNVQFGTADFVNVSDMQAMFHRCDSLEKVDLSDSTLTNVTNMQSMFRMCDNLKEVKFNKKASSKIETMQEMFTGCSSLESVDLSGFGTSNLFCTREMFAECGSLKNVNLAGWDVQKLLDCSYMFLRCSSLKECPVNGWKIKNVQTMAGLFSGCKSLEKVDIGGWNTESVTIMYYVFEDCESLKSLNLYGWNTPNLIGTSRMFSNCTSLTDLRIPKLDMRNVKYMDYMFQNCVSLKKLDLKNFSCENAETMEGLFSGCSSLQSLDLSNMRTEYAKSVKGMFTGCKSLKTIDMSGMELSELTDTESDLKTMFNGCGKLCLIKTPKHLEKKIALPNSKLGWYRDDSYTKLTYLPQKMNKSYPVHKQEDKNKFVDVRTDTWQYEYVNEAYKAKLMNGKDTTRDSNKLIIFDVDTNLTRAEFIQTLYNYEAKPDVKYMNVFKDVPKGKWYTNAVIWAYKHKLVSGIGDKKFGVDQKITRQDMITILYKYAKNCNEKYVSNASKYKLVGYIDAGSVSEYAKIPMTWANGNQIISGKLISTDKDNIKYKLAPKDTATRGECAAILTKYMKYINNFK